MSKKTKQGPRSRPRYPRFVRGANDVYRIGWNSDRDREYLIGILPRYVVEMVASRILDVRDDGGNFLRSDFKNLRDIEHGEILPKEIGRALLWLQTVGLIKKFARGFQIRPGVNLLEEWEIRWTQTPGTKVWDKKLLSRRR